MPTYFITKKNFTLYNPKQHDLVNIYFKKFQRLSLTIPETIEFIKKNNFKETKIIIYDINEFWNDINDSVVDLLNFINSFDIQLKIFFFGPGDWWGQNYKYCKKRKMVHRYHYRRLSFKAKNYKVITSVCNAEQLSYFHNLDYSPYKNNIISNNVWCCYNSSICSFNKNPVNKLFLSGSITRHFYPERVKLLSLHSENIIYHKRNVKSAEIKHAVETGINAYSQKLNKHIACFASPIYGYNITKKKQINTHILLQKVFEILASGSLLVYPKSEESFIKQFKLFHEENCFLIDFSKNLETQINYILHPSNRHKIDEIRHNGYIHGTTNFTSKKKFEEIENIINSS